MSPPLLLVFQLSQLLEFYHSLVVGILMASAQLSQALGACRWGAGRRRLRASSGCTRHLLGGAEDMTTFCC